MNRSKIGRNLIPAAPPPERHSPERRNHFASRLQSGQSGFTLIEMMIASLVFTVGVLSLMSMVLFALNMRFSSQVESTALRLSQQKIEELKSHPLDHAALANPGNPLKQDGTIDFDAAPVPDGFAGSEVTLNKTRDTKLNFETRWNVTLVGSKKVITVATRKLGGNPGRLMPVSLKVVLAP